MPEQRNEASRDARFGIAVGRVQPQPVGDIQRHVQGAPKPERQPPERAFGTRERQDQHRSKQSQEPRRIWLRFRNPFCAAQLMPVEPGQQDCQGQADHSHDPQNFSGYAHDEKAPRERASEPDRFFGVPGCLLEFGKDDGNQRPECEEQRDEPDQNSNHKKRACRGVDEPPDKLPRGIGSAGKLRQICQRRNRRVWRGGDQLPAGQIKGLPNDQIHQCHHESGQDQGQIHCPCDALGGRALGRRL